MMNIESLKIQYQDQISKGFDPEAYRQKIDTATQYIIDKLPDDFIPKIALTLGSGGLGDIANSFVKVATIPYEEIPGFFTPTVAGHAGNLVAGYIEGIPMIGYQGRHHYYEDGGAPDQVTALKNVVFPVYVAKNLGAELYIATNAAGGLNPNFKPGDLMIITSHLDTFFPNALLGPQVPGFDSFRFQPQHMEYNKTYHDLLHLAAKKIQESAHVHDGVYAALTGPTYESSADSRMLRTVGVDAVGMSTVPEVITAANIGMETLGISLITNVVAPDGTNATSHEEVTAALDNPQTKHRIVNILREFFRLYGKNS